ncbi:hypothetical protein [Streptomyces sp. Act143]|uniref:hypothetical protein n=1 Tax=Streptomyces sp. Act143 TaxID=2200760 RepID=UPI00215A484F|nr:hypothetical protein [Streptomyces sp. Act143]
MGDAGRASLVTHPSRTPCSLKLGGSVAPTAFGITEDTTGPAKDGQVGVMGVGFLAALSVLLVRGGGRNQRIPTRATTLPVAPEATWGTARIARPGSATA